MIHCQYKKVLSIDPSQVVIIRYAIAISLIQFDPEAKHV